LTSSVLSESVAKDTSIIVAYHPTIFNALKSFTLSNPLQTSLLHCAAQGISVYSPHTALDSVWGGVNDWLAEGLMKTKSDGEIRALVAEKLNPSSGESEGGEGRIATLKEPIAIDVLEKRIKSHLKLSQSLFLSSFSSKPHIVTTKPLLPAYTYSPSCISLRRQISIHAYPHSRHLRRVGRVYATWPGS
jgi:putative NIF3 family GTP cyclohydrolase 1 type 2